MDSQNQVFRQIVCYLAELFRQIAFPFVWAQAQAEQYEEASSFEKLRDQYRNLIKSFICDIFGVWGRVTAFIADLNWVP